MAARERRLLWNDEPFVPRAHRRCLERWTRNQLPGWRMAWASEVVPDPPAWEVNAWVARRLFARLWAALEENTLVVDAYLFPLGSVTWVAPLSRKRDLQAAPWKDYDKMSALADTWGLAVPAGNTLDLRSFSLRPWLNPNAPIYGRWIAEVIQAMNEGVLSQQELWLDFEAGLLKAPIYEELTKKRVFALAGKVAASEPNPEITSSRDQRAGLRSGSVQRRVNRYRRLANLAIDPSWRAQIRERALLCRDEIRVGLRSVIGEKVR